MGKFFYQKLAFSNMKKNSRFEVPYLITGILTVAAFYMIGALGQNSGLASSTHASIVKIMEFAQVVVAIFSAVILFYTDSFLMKRRKKELGLYNILGMEKRHIGYTLFFETLYSIIIAIGGGILIGLLLSKLMFMACGKLIDFEGMSFYVCIPAILNTLELFAAIYFASFIIHLLQLKLNNPIEMLKGGNVGEKEPKAKWLSAIIGIACIGAGYYISITTENPLQALTLFFAAVLLVIFGTYLLFMSVTIVLLKILRKNKSYYYKAKHFTAVSGLMYRMKQNAVGLASICILLTMVLVMVSTTFSLYTGVETFLSKIYIQNSYISYTRFSEEQDDAVKNIIAENADKYGLKIENLNRFYLLDVAGFKIDDGFSFDVDYDSYDTSVFSDIYTLSFITAEDYENATGKKTDLKDNEVLVYGDKEFPFTSFKTADSEWKVKGTLDLYPVIDADSVFNSYRFVVSDYSALERAYNANLKAYGDNASNIYTHYQFDFKGGNQEQIDAIGSIKHDIGEIMHDFSGDNNYSYYTSNKSMERRDSTSFFGGFFFIGIYLGLIFTLGMVLIIYYKQLSEGYEDRERYIIMQKVGMTHSEIKKSINSQVLIVFFLPLITAVCHLAAAYPMLKRLLKLFNMVDVSRFGISMIVTIAVFALIYFIVYKITSKIYYSIVS